MSNYYDDNDDDNNYENRNEYDYEDKRDDDDDLNIFTDDIEYKATYEQEVAALGKKNIAEECSIEGMPPRDNPYEYTKFLSKLSGSDRLKERVNIITLKLNDTNSDIFNFTVDDRNELCRSINSISLLNNNPKILNPTVYILGYWLTNGGGDIDTNKWNKILKSEENKIVLNLKLENESVHPEDCIRYCRFWKNLSTFL